MGLQAGQAAPEFERRSDDGAPVSLRALRGGWAALLFLPRTGSSGSSDGARPALLGLQAALPEFRRLSAQVVAVSLDTEARLAALRESDGLTFPVVPDGGRTLSRAYGVADGLAGLLGLPDRRTVLIDPAGVVALVRRAGSPAGQLRQALGDLERLQRPSIQHTTT